MKITLAAIKILNLSVKNFAKSFANNLLNNFYSRVIPGEAEEQFEDSFLRNFFKLNFAPTLRQFPLDVSYKSGSPNEY